jgi:hypothetical protein
MPASNQDEEDWLGFRRKAGDENRTRTFSVGNGEDAIVRHERHLEPDGCRRNPAVRFMVFLA